MKKSHILNIIAAIITLLLIINWIFTSSQTTCFSWFDYMTNFGTFFIDMGINIFAALEY
ncbi:MAG: hypothetical protein AABX16_04975 [Nanoarchaeota archaeon]